MSERVVWTYWISRNSLQGELSGKCDVWYRKPMRVKHSYRVTWVANDHRDPGHLGEHTLKDCAEWFKTIPETDLELIVTAIYPTEQQIKDAT
jgi:hypothetical protein